MGTPLHRSVTKLPLPFTSYDFNPSSFLIFFIAHWNFYIVKPVSWVVHDVHQCRYSNLSPLTLSITKSQISTPLIVISQSQFVYILHMGIKGGYRSKPTLNPSRAPIVQILMIGLELEPQRIRYNRAPVNSINVQFKSNADLTVLFSNVPLPSHCSSIRVPRLN